MPAPSPCPSPRTIARTLLRWLGRHGRTHLPWRGEDNAYRVLVSEMMLQQTQVERVIPFYRAWIERFPDIASLARASEADALAAWKGLGYYRRARSLKHLADELHARGESLLPASREALMDLPGIGPYTASAVLAFAHDRPEPAIDTNIARVVTRVFGLGETGKSREACETKLGEMLRHSGARDLHGALMDFGSMVCTARTPACSRCPLRASCAALANGGPVHNTRTRATQSELGREPRRRPARALAAVGALRDGRRVLLPPRGGLLLAKIGPGINARAALQAEARQRYGVEIAVRPACARVTRAGRETSLHRCSLLYGDVARFSGADAKRLSTLSPQDRAALALMKLGV